MKTKINWMEWNKESFDKAKKEDKPILLDLTAVWCHWCHVMDATSYSDDEIAGIINRDFIPIKVYIDQRPDVKERYNMGGFPSTVFLNSDGSIITGETFVPADRLKTLLESVKSAYKIKINDDSGIVQEIKEKNISKGKIDSEIVKHALIAMEDSFDMAYGGFGMQPKFPPHDAIDLLFLQNQEKYNDLALKTLDGMYDGIFDKVDFGFYRYSVTQDWKTPHFEKMLDTNAGLLRNYLDAYRITKNDKYKKIALQIIGYISRSLSDQANGGFYGSQDADEHFYQLKDKERLKANQPYIDRTIYVDWNSMMVSSYIKAGSMLDDDAVSKFALKTVDFILKHCYDKEKGLCHFFDGTRHVDGLLSDNIRFLDCLIEAYVSTNDEKYLLPIKDVNKFILNNLYDQVNGGFFDRITTDEDFGTLKQKDKPFLENSFCAIVYLKLFQMEKDVKYKEIAVSTLLLFSDAYRKYGHFSAIYALAVQKLNK